MMETTWYLQYLSFEDLYYLVEMHPQDGIIEEHFFDTKTETKDYIKRNYIPIKKERYEEVLESV